jgi:hypothetical protein
MTNVAAKLGTRRLYTVLGVGFHPGDELVGTGPERFERGTRRVSTLFGVGWRFALPYDLFPFLELEAAGSSVRKAFIAADNGPAVYALRAQTALRLARHFSLLAGVGVNVAVGWSGRDADLGLGVLESVSRSGGTTVRIYPGFVLGVQI